MKMKNVLYILSILLIFSCKTDTENKSIPSVNANGEASTISTENGQTLLKNVYYKPFSYTEGETPKNVFLKINQEETIKNGSLFSVSKMKISSEAKTWTIETKAHNLSIKNNTLVAESISDYDHEDTYSLYNIETGAHLLDYSYNCLTARIPASNFKRYIGFVAKSNCNDLLKDYDEDVLGILTYASEEKTLQKFLIKTKADLGKSTPGMELISFNEEHTLYDGNQLLYMMNLEENHKFSDLNFAFALKFYIGEQAKESTILFEVVEDKISLKAAKYDSKVFQIVAE